jgi:hypothetical protein
MALTLPVVYGLASHDGLLYRTLRAENHQIGIGPPRYSSFSNIPSMSAGVSEAIRTASFRGLPMKVALLRTACLLDHHRCPA